MAPIFRDRLALFGRDERELKGGGMRYVGRIAPSPTGLLHVGHAATFWRARERAREAGGVLRLRNEDLDSQRCRLHFVKAMLEDLSWLGIEWQGEMVTQSERLPLYREAFERLLAGGHVYPCVCSRKDIAAMMQAPHEERDDEPVYRGRCRGRVARENEACNFRFRVPDGRAVEFLDRGAGEQSFRAGCGEGADFGDFLVWRRDGLPSYQLACVVDDAAMGVTEVVRGRDLLRSTARQILLQQALGLGSPDYFHAPLVVDERGVRLAKRNDVLSVRTLRAQGLRPAEVVAMFPKEPAGGEL